MSDRKEFVLKEGDTVLCDYTPSGAPCVGRIVKILKNEIIAAFDGFIHSQYLDHGWPGYGHRCCWSVGIDHLTPLNPTSPIVDEGYNDLFI